MHANHVRRGAAQGGPPQSALSGGPAATRLCVCGAVDDAPGA